MRTVDTQVTTRVTWSHDIVVIMSWTLNIASQHLTHDTAAHLNDPGSEPGDGVSDSVAGPLGHSEVNHKFIRTLFSLIISAGKLKLNLNYLIGAGDKLS